MTNVAGNTLRWVLLVYPGHGAMFIWISNRLVQSNIPNPKRSKS